MNVFNGLRFSLCALKKVGLRFQLPPLSKVGVHGAFDALCFQT